MVDAAGAPVAGAVVSIVESTVPMPEIALVADADGRFDVRLPHGRFTLRAHGAGREGEVEVTGDDDIRIVIGD